MGRLTDERLRAIEERQRLMEEALDGLVYDWDVASGRVERSIGLHALLGFEPEEVPSDPAWWRARIHPDDLVRNDAAAVDALAARAPTFAQAYRIRHRDDHWVQVCDKGRIVYADDGQVRRMVGCSIDVTAHRLAEQRLREREEHYRALFEANPHPMWVYDLETLAFLDVNQAAIQKYGYTREEFLAMTIADIRPEVDVTRLRAAIAALTDDGVTVAGPWRHRRKDGTLLDVEISSHGCEVDGRRARLVLAHDITGRKRAEDALREQDRRKDEFLAMLAHELRNPLAPIRNALDLLGAAGPVEGPVAQARAVIERQVHHMVRLVDDLLDVSRVSRGKVTLQRGPVELGSVLRDAVETARPLIEARRHQVVTRVPPAPVVVDGDPTRLTQVVSNLLNNAAKYTDEGGHLELVLERGSDPDEARIRVRDDGRGIEPAALASVFDLFYQGDRNLDRAEGGLGIGLSLVKSLVELHGGRVEAHSAGRGHGTEVIVRLPCLVTAVAPVRPPAVARPSLPVRGLRVLVVDDNPDSVETLAAVLALDGHRPSTARDGRQAVALALAERPDVVLLDIGLPELDGYQACRAMRLGGLDRALIVALTGYGQSGDREAAALAGFDQHLVKPVELARLRTVLAASR